MQNIMFDILLYSENPINSGSQHECSEYGSEYCFLNQLQSSNNPGKRCHSKTLKTGLREVMLFPNIGCSHVRWSMSGSRIAVLGLRCSMGLQLA